VFQIKGGQALNWVPEVVFRARKFIKNGGNSGFKNYSKNWVLVCEKTEKLAAVRAAIGLPAGRIPMGIL